MKNRRSFLAAVAAGSAGIALAKAAPADGQAATMVTPAPLTPAPLMPAIAPASPAATATPKLASFGSAAFAATMREIDPALTQEQLDAIAKAIDGNRDAAKTLNPTKKRLKNSDEPAVHFAVLRGDA